jgi:hypothetical protein
MSEKKKKPTIIGHVKVGRWGGGTMAEFLAWREAENLRMERELAAQCEAFFELQNGRDEALILSGGSSWPPSGGLFFHMTL